MQLDCGLCGAHSQIPFPNPFPILCAMPIAIATSFWPTKDRSVTLLFCTDLIYIRMRTNLWLYYIIVLCKILPLVVKISDFVIWNVRVVILCLRLQILNGN